jgi:Tol biopolymer transport system component
LTARRIVDYAMQITAGLAAAHEKGIVHRDLKPGNVFVTQDERVKILDFGLARLRSSLGIDGSTSGVETASAITDPGAILGTVGYMSPEQLQARPVDHRSDIFSFGSLLYEMLSGRRPFVGDSAAETMAAILKQEPPELASEGSPVLRGLERVARRCLEKDRTSRFQSARDIGFALEAIATSSGVSTAPPALSGAAGGQRFRSPWWLATAAALLALVPAAYFAGRSRERPLPTFERLTYRRGYVVSARFAPDGESLVYGAAWDGEPVRLFFTRAGSSESRPLDLPAGDVLSISSLGEMALSLSCRRVPRFGECIGTLARAPLGGGAPRELATHVAGADWSPDGKDLAVVREEGDKRRLEMPLGTLLFEGPATHPRVSPNGDFVAFFDASEDPKGSLRLVDRKGSVRTLLSGEYRYCTGIAWSPAGNEVFFTALDSLARAWVLRGVTLRGSERVLHTDPNGLTVHDVGRRGGALFVRFDVRFSIHGLLPGSGMERDLSWFASSLPADVSDDGHTLLFLERSSGLRYRPGIYLRRTDGTPAVRLGDGWRARLSPDGRWVAGVNNDFKAITLMPTGPGETRILPAGDLQRVDYLRWFPDGRRLLIKGSGAKGPGRSYMQDLEGGTPTPVTPEGIEAELATPDGQSVLAGPPEGPVSSVYSLSGGPPREIPGLDKEDGPLRWSPDGKSLLVARTEPLRFTLSRIDVMTGSRSAIRTVAAADPAGILSFGDYVTVTPDGRYYAYGVWRTLNELYFVRGLP